MNDQFDAYVLTNGRSSLPYCLESLKGQSVPINVNMVQDMSMEAAMNHIVKVCQTPWFLKIDDDFLLHPRTVECLRRVKLRPTWSMYYWYLYDVCTGKTIQSFKLYNAAVAREVGFRARSSGRVDPNFLKDVAARWPVHADNSMVALQLCPPWEDQERYEHIWTENSPKTKGAHRKATRRQMQQYKVPLSEQVTLLTKLESQKSCTFTSFLRNGK